MDADTLQLRLACMSCIDVTRARARNMCASSARVWYALW